MRTNEMLAVQAMHEELMAEIERLKAEVELWSEKICEPAPGQYVAQCHWSKTGWAVWEKDGSCTCKPARRPSNT